MLFFYQGNSYGTNGLVKEHKGNRLAYFLHVGQQSISQVTIVDDGDAGVIEMKSSTAKQTEPASYVDPNVLTSVTITVTRNLGIHRTQRKNPMNLDLYNPSSPNNFYGNLSVLYTTYNGTEPSKAAHGNVSPEQLSTTLNGVKIVQELGKSNSFPSRVNSVGER